MNVEQSKTTLGMYVYRTLFRETYIRTSPFPKNLKSCFLLIAAPVPHGFTILLHLSALYLIQYCVSLHCTSFITAFLCTVPHSLLLHFSVLYLIHYNTCLHCAYFIRSDRISRHPRTCVFVCVCVCFTHILDSTPYIQSLTQ